MTEPAPGLGSQRTHSFVTPQRLRLTEAVRHLIDATLTAEDATEDALNTAAEAAERIAADLAGTVPGTRPGGVRTRREDAHGDYLPRSPLVGAVSPMAPPLDYRYVEHRLHARGTFHAAYEGPPGYVHGGWIALAFDEILGMTTIASGHPGMTGKLTIRYRRPTPLHTAVHLEGWAEHVDGRRIVVKGTLTADGTVTAEAEGLFVAIDAERAMEYFGRVREQESPDPLP